LVSGRTLPVDRVAARTASLVRGAAGVPPFSPSGSVTLGVSNFLALAPAIAAGGTTFTFGDAAKAGQVPHYSVSTLAITHATWRLLLGCEPANAPSQVTTPYPQWIVIRPRGNLSTSCAGFTSPVSACERFTLPALPGGFPEATSAPQKQSGFEATVGSGAA